MSKIKVLIVDDSVFARTTISRNLGSDPSIEVVGYARDGVEAVEKVKALKPDVVTLDVVMPRMDGLTALGRIMSECPTPVVMLSALTGEQTKATILALEMGAADFLLKPTVLSPAWRDGMAMDLISKIKMAATISVSNLGPIARPNNQPTRKNVERGSRSVAGGKVVVIGCSTGGPRALAELIPGIPKDLPAAILVVQHMPPGFTTSLAARLAQLSEVRVKEAEAGDRLNNGQVLLAPGGYHMVVSKRRVIELNQEPPVCGVRPSVDVTMESVAKVCGAGSLGVVLTGMGSDGTHGAESINKAGGKVAVEHESTCVVYGMPRSVVTAGGANSVVPLGVMADEIVRMCTGQEETHS